MSITEVATDMLALLEAFSNKQSNAVLDVLAGKTLKQDEKFPDGELHFPGAGWRGFYHCHDGPGKDDREHGHFHLFVDVTDNQTMEPAWSHLAGLSVDYEGQPIRWFTVNNWVTGGKWLPAEELRQFLGTISRNDAQSLSEQWLLCMLSLYTDSLDKLLIERDRVLIQINAGSTLADSLLDRDIYMLSLQPVDLKQKLVSVMEATIYHEESTL